MTDNKKSRATREAYGEAILELGTIDKQVYVVDCDIGKSCKTTEFSNKLPNQYVNVGIAEQNAAGVAAGLASCGKIPFVTTYAIFGSTRMLEQIRQEACYTKLNVKIACSHAGLTPANDGASHQCIEDMGVLRTIPNMTIVMGADFNSSKKLVKAVAEYDGPVYIRFTRDAVPYIYHEDEQFEIGKAKKVATGKDLTIITNGNMLNIALSAKEVLEKENISVSILDMHTIKPLDKNAVLEEIMLTGKIITIEDHNIINGLGSAVCEVVAESGMGIVRRIGVQDQFGESASYEQLLHKNGITIENVLIKAREMFCM